MPTFTQRRVLIVAILKAMPARAIAQIPTSTAQRQPPVNQWDGDLNLRKRSTNMRRHVIRALDLDFHGG